MRYDPDKHHRRSIRRPHWDYTSAGAYFVTIVTHGREMLFDDPVLRGVAETAWQDIPRHFPRVALGEWVVMPNHVHGIIWIADDDGRGEAFPDRSVANRGDGSEESPRSANGFAGNASPLQHNDNPRLAAGSLGAILGNFKSVSARRINQVRHSPGTPVWQRNYWERIIRNERELRAVQQYIGDNPMHWLEDTENPLREEKAP